MNFAGGVSYAPAMYYADTPGVTSEVFAEE
jgi:hypothetical protein